MTAKDIYSKYYIKKNKNSQDSLHTMMVKDYSPGCVSTHASHGNNLLGNVKDQVNQYVHDMTIKGFLVQRIPTVDIFQLILRGCETLKNTNNSSLKNLVSTLIINRK